MAETIPDLHLWSKCEQVEENGVVTIKITIDKAALIKSALPTLLAKMNDPPAPPPKKKRKSPTKKGAPKADLPGQSFMPGTDDKAKSWIAPPGVPEKPPLTSEPVKPAGGSSFPFGANELPALGPPGAGTPAKAKNPLYGIAVVTNPGETLAAAKERVKREQAALAALAVTA
jgi:hypothetical protein